MRTRGARRTVRPTVRSVALGIISENRKKFGDDLLDPDCGPIPGNILNLKVNSGSVERILGCIRNQIGVVTDEREANFLREVYNMTVRL